jgi:hypothetical protein
MTNVFIACYKQGHLPISAVTIVTKYIPLNKVAFGTNLGSPSITEALKASRASKVGPERYFVQRYIFSDYSDCRYGVDCSRAGHIRHGVESCFLPGKQNLKL